MSLQSVAHLWSIRSWSNSAAGSSISLPWTETPSVNCSGKNHTTCGLAQSLCICSEAIQLQKQKYLDTIVNLFSSVFVENYLGLLQVFSLPFKDHKVHHWEHSSAELTTQVLTSHLFSGNFGIHYEAHRLWFLSQPGSLSYLSRRVGLEKKERPLGPSSIKDAVPHPTNGLLGLEGI